MNEYYVQDTNHFFDTITKIKNEGNKEAYFIIENSIDHCHLIRFLKDVKLCITGQKNDYNIYLDPKELSSNPNWKFNSTLFFFWDNNDIIYSNLNFVYTIQQYDFIDDPIWNSFGMVLMEFYNSKIIFKNCLFENKTNRAFEIITKDKSFIIFDKCEFIGNFNFIFDLSSNIRFK
ncbi:hypothetical protein [Flavobacterium limi]|uniref:Right handed beta helix region n=1 Tax=Flavobacterium limi TaxID=2045105 RepID=A0ABQ1UYF4_9FLAO|nr:hypothetical protein [Flavobacterium limi]GGF29983.1 hypothetical protein GCM10011518_44030 [Flavobacterium limi]